MMCEGQAFMLGPLHFADAACVPQDWAGDAEAEGECGLAEGVVHHPFGDDHNGMADYAFCWSAQRSGLWFDMIVEI